jgi:lipid-binding SYLF domain-containing protein
MTRFILAAILAVVPLAAQAQTQQQALVDRATLTVQEMMGVPDPTERLAVLRRARAVMICPRVFHAGFVLGGSGGTCVLVARDGGGSWSSPAFYGLGGGSVGLQIGVQDSELIMMILTDRGLSAVMDTQFTFGGDASVAFAAMGSGVGSESSGALADIELYSQTRGLFAGVQLGGAVMTTDTASNRAYYGRELAARQIVIQMDANNQGANPLRSILTRLGAPLEALTPRQVAATPSQSSLVPVQRDTVQRETLAPPPR